MKSNQVQKSSNAVNKKRYLYLLPVFVLLIIVVILLYRHNQQSPIDKEAKQQYLTQLSAQTYDSVFFSMFPTDNYAEEDFSTYRGINTTLSPYTIPNLKELSEHLDTALQSGNEITRIYLGIDPYLIWTSSNENPKRWEKDINNYLLAYPEAYPDITFEVILPYPPLSYWTEMEEKQMENVLSAYRTAICALAPYSNTTTFFVGAQHWLIANPGSYEDTFNTNREVSKKIMLLTFCDNHYKITDLDVDIAFDQFKAYIKEEKNNLVEYPDLTEWQVVFFGDSIIGNFTGSPSIPGVVNGLTNASVYNFAIGGTPATYEDTSDRTFQHILDRFLTGELTVTQDDTVFSYDADSDKKLCFVINYGLNDYFSGAVVSNPENPYDRYTYTGSLRTGIKKLREAYPEAIILLQTPTPCSYFSYGTDINSANGGVLTDYVKATIEVAETETSNVYYLDNYTDLGINEQNLEEYAPDGCHLDEDARFLAATHLIAFLEQY